MTLADVGGALGLANGNFVGMVERGERTPSDEKLLHLARVLQLDARKLLALKYEGSHPAAFDVLLAAPRPRFPRLRKLLLASCENPGPMAAEFDTAAYGLLEHLVFHALLDRVLLPGLQGDPYAPRRLRERILAHRELHPDEPMATAAFEEEAETFIPWVRGELPMLSWKLDPTELRLYVSRGGGDKGDWSFSLKGRDAPPAGTSSPQSGARAAASSGGPRGPGLREQLRELGLGPEEVKEVLDLIEWKKARIKQQAEESD
jgi:transcriptional regulator with XRE-family HTH domain